MEEKNNQNPKIKITVELANYRGLTGKRNKSVMSEEEVEQSLDYLRKSRVKTITVNKPAKKGNRVEVDFEIRNAGVKIEDGISKNHPIILGDGRFLPGFESYLEGMSVGEKKEFSLKAPDNWPDKRIADKNLECRVEMKLVQERTLPELNDEFAKSLGNFESLEILKKNIAEGTLKEKEAREEQRIKIELIEKVAQESKIEVPQTLIEREIDRMIDEFKFSISSFDLDFSTYLKEIGKTIEDFKKDWRNQAEQRVRVALCLQAIADKENIEVSDEEINERINAELKNYPNIEEAKKDIDPEKLKEYTREALRNEKVLGLLEKEAKITN